MGDHHHDASDYVKGEMNISEHKATYAAFGDMTKWGSLICAVGLVFLVLLTCVKGAGLIGAGAVAFVLAALGYLFLR